MTLGGLLLAAALTACSGQDSSTTQPPEQTPPTSPSSTATHGEPGHHHTKKPHHHKPSKRPSSTPTTTPPTPGASDTTAPPASDPPTKVLVFMVENHSYAQMRDQMPWTFGVATQFGYATDYHAIQHPSLPNYLAIAGGSTFGVNDDQDPAAHPVRSRSVFGAAIAAGRTAGVYAEGMPEPCYRENSGRYAVRHNPWTYFVYERGPCVAHDLPLTAYANDVRTGHLPDAGMVVPDMCDIAHDCPLSRADAFLRQYAGLAMRGPDFRSGRLVIVVTADEDDRHSGNQVLTVVAREGMEPHQVVGTSLTHYSLTRLFSEVNGTPPLANAGGASSMTTAFGLG